MSYSGLASASRNINSFSIASRINSARRFLPAIASMRSGKSSGSRTSIGFTFIGGRPMRAGIFDTGKLVNFFSICTIKRYLLLTVTDIGYKFKVQTREIDMTTQQNLNKASELFKASVAAGEKVKRNAHKLAWMDATRRMADVVISSESQLAQYERDAKAAAKTFSDFVTGWSTEDVVAAIGGAA